MESAVNQEMDPAVKQQLIKHSKGWRGINNPWMADGDEHEEFQYINLVVNPERYTGYKVSSIEVTMKSLWTVLRFRYWQRCRLVFAATVSCTLRATADTPT